VAAGAALLLAGCSTGKPTGTLAGAVTYKGQPVVGMQLEVHRDGSGISTSAPLDAGGRFEVEAPIPVGVYELAVYPRPMADPATAAKMTKVPAKAQDRKTSGLTVEVKPGRNDVAIEIPD
jgi:hypothetical protein